MMNAQSKILHINTSPWIFYWLRETHSAEVLMSPSSPAIRRRRTSGFASHSCEWFALAD
jgi:hypothetical protein